MAKKQITYKDSGVDIDAGEESVQRIKDMVTGTFNQNVIREIGHFGAMFQLPLAEFREPVLVSSVDGIGTKLKVAVMMEKHDTIGEDLVNHCVNDILTTGAAPLYFLDYLSLGKVNPDVVKQIVSGMVRGCKKSNCALIGGETAEMGDLYQPGEYDLAGTIVGIVEKSKIIDGSRIQVGDKLVGLPSNGLHTNGYTLAREILFRQYKKRVDDVLPESNQTIGDELMRIHRNYFPMIHPLFGNYDIRGLAHITGGGIEGNVKRIIPQDLRVVIDWSAWETPEIFNLLQEMGQVPGEDMRRTFNLGIGFVLVIPPTELDDVQNQLKSMGEISYYIGEVKASQ